MTFKQLEQIRKEKIKKNEETGFLFSEKIKSFFLFFKSFGISKHFEKETYYENFYHIHWRKRIFSTFYASYTDCWMGKEIIVPKYINRLIRFIFGKRKYQYFYTYLDFENNECGNYITDWIYPKNIIDYKAKKALKEYLYGENYKDEKIEFSEIEYNGFLFGKKGLDLFRINMIKSLYGINK